MQRYSICEEGRGLNWQLRVIMEMCLESGYGVIDGVGGCTEYLRDGIRPESESEKVVKKGVPLQGWPQSPQIVYIEGLRGVSDESPRCVPVHEHLLVPRSYVQFHILPT